MVYFLVLSVFRFEFFHFLLDNFSLRSVINSIESHLLFKLFLHLVFFELLLPLFVLFLQVSGGLFDQLLKVLFIELGRPDIKMLRYLKMFLVYSLILSNCFWARCLSLSSSCLLISSSLVL